MSEIYPDLKDTKVGWKKLIHVTVIFYFLFFYSMKLFQLYKKKNWEIENWLRNRKLLNDF